MKQTREEWLNLVAEGMAPWFDEAGYPLPKFRVSVGFPSHGAKGKRIGECWDAACSKDRHFEILIRPDQDDALFVAHILCHELIHAAVGLEHGHKGPFPKLARQLGLEGKMTATIPGAVFKQRAAPIMAAYGPIPHAALMTGASTAPKKQTTRLIKCECEECGYTVRTARKWIDEKGAPHCPEHGRMTYEGDDLDGDLREAA